VNESAALYFLKSSGVYPVCFLNSFEKYLTLSKSTSLDISFILLFVLNSRSFAFEIFKFVKYLMKFSPNSLLNSRQKYSGLKWTYILLNYNKNNNKNTDIEETEPEN